MNNIYIYFAIFFELDIISKGICDYFNQFQAFTEIIGELFDGRALSIHGLQCLKQLKVRTFTDVGHSSDS